MDILDIREVHVRKETEKCDTEQPMCGRSWEKTSRDTEYHTVKGRYECSLCRRQFTELESRKAHLKE